MLISPIIRQSATAPTATTCAPAPPGGLDYNACNVAASNNEPLVFVGRVRAARRELNQKYAAQKRTEPKIRSTKNESLIFLHAHGESLDVKFRVHAD